MFDLHQLDLEVCRICNLNCNYCYLGKLPQKDAIMSRETVDLALQFVEKFGVTTRKGKRRPTRINFYGGEPMLAWDVMTDFVLKAEAKGYKLGYIIVSNGTIGTQEQVDFAKAHGMSITRSIDGCEEALACGRGIGHPTLLDTFKKQTELWQDQNKPRRMTFVPEAAKWLHKSINFVHDELGIVKGGGTAPDLYREWSEEHLQDAVESMWKIAEEYVHDWLAGTPFHFTWFTKEARRFRATKPRPGPCQQGCGASGGLTAIAWDGFVYPCHRFTSEEHDSPYCFGHISDALAGTARGYGEEFTERYAWLRSGGVPEGCKTCISNTSCTGGCMHNNMKRNGDVSKNPTEFCRFKQEIHKVVSWIDARLRVVQHDWYSTKGAAAYQKRLEAQKKARSAAKSKTLCDSSKGTCKCKVERKKVPYAGSIVAGIVATPEIVTRTIAGM